MVRGAKALMCMAAVFVLAPAACSKGDKKKNKDTFPKAVLEDLNAAGLKVGSFDSVNPDKYKAEACAKGEINDLEILLCRYASEKGAKSAESRLLKFVGKAVTGVARSKGKIAIVVVDRNKTDLKGKTINKVIKAFRKDPL